MKKKKGRFSRFLNPTLIIVDLLIIIIIISVVSSAGPFLLILLSFSWIVISTFTRFYQVFRFTPEIKIFALILIQYLFFTLSFFAIIGIFGSTELLNNKFLEVNHILSLSTIIIITVGAFKFFVYYLLLRFRVVFGGNYRKTIIIGSGDETKFLSNYFNDKKEAGFKLKKIFSDELNINTITNFILKEGIDEVYCCLTSVNPEMLNQIVNFAESNLKEVKFIPSYGKVYSKKIVYQNYDFIPILSLRTIHLEDPFNSFIKRCFDVLFSLLVIVLFLSWVTPLLAILIKIDSKGPIFFKQKRNGFNFQEFYCYKFRSMKINKQANILQATKNDFRVTKLGKVLRKFSLDELPQFFNVLIGDMSVV